jgi:hypothetical protein
VEEKALIADSTRWLSKSDFLVARSCPGKLYFKKHAFPSVVEQDDYMEMLADGGFMIEKMAQLCYPEGIEANGTNEEALKETEEQLKRDSVTLFQPAVFSKGKFIRVDILRKNGVKLELIEVKSKSFDSAKFDEYGRDATRYFEKKEWSEYIEDVAFQKYVLQERLPKAQIEAYLLLPDKAKKAAVEGMIGWFKLFKSDSWRPRVDFTGDPNAVRESNFLTLVGIDEIVDRTISLILDDIALYTSAVTSEKRLKAVVSIKCRDCEYNDVDAEHPKSGFALCWGNRAESSPHILTLGQLGNINKSKDCINKLIAEGKSGVYDVPESLVRDKYNNRPYYQVAKKDEFLLPEFGEVLDQIEYPLHFVDFETSMMAMPYHAGMRPYQRVLFQWSCHTIEKPGATPTHAEWINTKDVCPNVEFGQSLNRCLGEQGSILTWSGYENTQLRYLLDFIDENGIDNPRLLRWLQATVSTKEHDPGRIVDLNKVALKCYFHPLMGARTSIKVTLPAVLSSATSERIKNLLRAEGLFQLDESGVIQDPYSLLPPFEIYGQSETVHDGTGAMRAYQEMLYGDVSSDQAARREYEKALLRYCKVDTLAMVLIWEHWLYLHNIDPKPERTPSHTLAPPNHDR